MKHPAEKENTNLSNLPSASGQKNGTWLPMIMAGVFLIAFAALFLIVFWNYISPWAVDWYDFLSSKEKVRAWLMSFGSAAPLVFILIQSLQVVVAPIPGEATGFLGGFLFGIPMGFLYSTVGLTVGSTIAFVLGRWLEIHFVEKVVQKKTLEKFDFIIERQGVLIAFLLFLIPGFPKDYLCFILGLSKMPLQVFLIICKSAAYPGPFCSPYKEQMSTRAIIFLSLFSWESSYWRVCSCCYIRKPCTAGYGIGVKKMRYLMGMIRNAL